VSASNPNYLQAELLWAQLSAAGVSHVVISPGSRSTPLARTALLSEKFNCHVVIDERSAGFFALGLAKGSSRPVALVCTSGTAAAHYYPAVIEAAQSGSPLVVVTADRPQRMRNTGAPQTIDQTALFGRYTRMYLDLPEPVASVNAMRETLSCVKRALLAMLSAPIGPIQINVPMDEPLVPVEVDAAACREIFALLLPEIDDVVSPAPSTVELTAKLLRTVESSLCGLIVCGPDAARTKQERDALFELARTLGWPVLADVASGMRFCGEPNMPYYDIFLRHESLSRISPDLVLEFGMAPTSKALTQYLNRHRAKTIRVQRDTLPRDPDERASEIIITNVAPLLRELKSSVKVSRDSLLLDPFWKAVGEIRSSLTKFHLPHESELAYVNAAIAGLPDKSNLVLASSMPIRYADIIAAPCGKDIRVYSQRGTNGIDGVISHAAGVAAGSTKQTLLICGDLAFWHDLQGLSLARQTEHLTVLLLNNNGGGIFHFLPVAEYADSFDEIHATPNTANLSGIARANSAPCVLIKSVEECRSTFQKMLPGVIEVQTNRVKNHAAHQHFVESMLREFDSC